MALVTATAVIARRRNSAHLEYVHSASIRQPQRRPQHRGTDSRRRDRRPSPHPLVTASNISSALTWCGIIEIGNQCGGRPLSMRRKSRTPCQSFGSHCQPLGDLSIRRRARCGFAASPNTAQSREPRGGWLTANPPRPRDAVAEALDYARQRGLLHRDVKPSNLLLANPDDGQQRILLADFGIARQLADISGLTATNLTVGTVAYAAPEQLIGLDIDGRADQYALAVTAFHLLTGAPSFQHSKPVAVISQHLNQSAPQYGPACAQ